ncbi:hypothetical protein OHB35_15600 [Streptomyces phaeochromogenes]|uniref:Uncharacterized protein n=1 Tax=Streptomyces phaeochromogenes TaxID=1923 RepID=A0ABZ1H8S4_STRPH|nr:hypothetical protein [Streptomyces phaeochromogenes]WSD14555.1 hypothetical protein OHB35_15600 [Streptomyces phaeochromogenes]
MTSRVPANSKAASLNDLTLFADTPTIPAGLPPSPTGSVVHGAVIISAIETTWREIRHRFDGVPDISVTIPPTAGAQDPTKCTALRTGRRFVRDGHLPMELQVSSAALALGGRPMMEGLLPHAAHGLALTRGIVDVSGGDRRWHNKKFGNLAREVGLVPPARAARVIVMGRCPLSDSEARKWTEVIAALDGAATVQLQATVKAVAPPRGGRSGSRFAIVCECTPVPRRQQVTPHFYEQGPLLWGVCLAVFRPADSVVLPAQPPGRMRDSRPGRAATVRAQERSAHRHGTTDVLPCRRHR